ncbi:HAD-like domain-containing protein [Xylaria bambusicola]|uniref:HAD-like domain-containing protein n=1 Tax=Xylaria bambusicola TaxID=326684 RepID=UPI002007C3F6|nr:HAD-like domain-containing protein [Xylaria bambusicola]KAI0521792.1 HAD-like domain-containing protein [Xylaria bambusicola]
MADQKPPKVLLFDIGGVCVVSPFQSILDYELSLGIPPGWVNYSISKTAPNGFWHRLERGEILLDDAFYAGFNEDLHNAERWTAFYKAQAAKDLSRPQHVPDVPKMDGRWLFNDMMTASMAPDPWMYPALQRLKENGHFILAAMSNTVIFPKGHPLFRDDFYDDPVRSLFDVFVSSAHVGLRKPDPRIYKYTLQEVDRFARANASSEKGQSRGWMDGVTAAEVVFLDDIGENLKGGRNIGFRTIKVPLGKAFEAVDELEAITGLQLAGDHPRIPLKPKLNKPIAKI